MSWLMTNHNISFDMHGHTTRPLGKAFKIKLQFVKPDITLCKWFSSVWDQTSLVGFQAGWYSTFGLTWYCRNPSSWCLVSRTTYDTYSNSILLGNDTILSHLDLDFSLISHVGVFDSPSWIILLLTHSTMSGELTKDSCWIDHSLDVFDKEYLSLITGP